MGLIWVLVSIDQRSTLPISFGERFMTYRCSLGSDVMFLPPAFAHHCLNHKPYRHQELSDIQGGEG